MSAEAATFVLEAFCASDVGCKRRLNEDSYIDRGDIGLWAVADGMGGHAAGDFASQTICNRLGEVVPLAEPSAFLQAVAVQIQTAHEELRVESQRRGDGSVIGSTVVALLAARGHFACLWAGDSRLYLLREGDLRQVSRDHSLVQQLVDAGDLTAEDAENHPQANVVTRAVGAIEVLELERRHEALRDGDVLLLCSDGLTGLMPDDEIEAVLRQAPDQSGVDAMIATALERGAPDNVTIVMVVCRTASPSGRVGASATPGGDDEDTHLNLSSPNPAPAEPAPGTPEPVVAKATTPDDFDEILSAGQVDPGSDAPPPTGQADRSDDDPLAAILADGPHDRKDAAGPNPTAQLGATKGGPGAAAKKGGGLKGFFGRLGRGGNKKP